MNGWWQHKGVARDVFLIFQCVRSNFSCSYFISICELLVLTEKKAECLQFELRSTHWHFMSRSHRGEAAPDWTVCRAQRIIWNIADLFHCFLFLHPDTEKKNRFPFKRRRAAIKKSRPDECVKLRERDGETHPNGKEPTWVIHQTSWNEQSAALTHIRRLNLSNWKVSPLIVSISQFSR